MELIEDIIQRGVQSGEFKKLDIRMTALSIMVNIESINWFTLFDTHGVSVKEYMQTITDFILAGILKNDKESNEASLKYVIFGSFA
ncbi:hypothetical protein [Mesonia mobilis]|uniref:hypothetical protein n=1 Tax=Mesonia mobilis TaxID=369791 RepID=UPI003F74A8B0